MNLQKSYIVLLVENLTAAERWYTKLFGRGRDNRPIDLSPDVPPLRGRVLG
jgi:hypothetical protein